MRVSPCSMEGKKWCMHWRFAHVCLINVVFNFLCILILLQNAGCVFDFVTECWQCFWFCYRMLAVFLILLQNAGSVFDFVTECWQCFWSCYGMLAVTLISDLFNIKPGVKIPWNWRVLRVAFKYFASAQYMHLLEGCSDIYLSRRECFMCTVSSVNWLKKRVCVCKDLRTRPPQRKCFCFCVCLHAHV